MTPEIRKVTTELQALLTHMQRYPNLHPDERASTIASIKTLEAELEQLDDREFERRQAAIPMEIVRPPDDLF